MIKTCIFTIVSRNYLHYARTLMASVEQFAPQADRLVGLCDQKGDFDFSGENFSLLEIQDLDIPAIEKFIFRYTILELNTAIKPYIISALFEQGYDKVIYFDPDIRIYRSLDNMLELLDEHQILLTPHLTGPLDDDKSPSELNILVSGSYNLGYVGLRNTPDSRRFAKWWQDKLYTDCVVDLERGLFVDQKWVDLVPGMYEGVYINRNPAWNTAYWNLNHRRLTQVDNDYEVNGEPLLFFHFSGFSGDSPNLSKHQNRFTKKSAGSAVASLCEDYANTLEKNGLQTTRSLPYAYGFFADGTPVPDFARYIYREDYDWENSSDDPYEKQGAANFLGYLNEAISLNGQRIPWITRLAYKLYRARPDLQQAFPDLSGAYGKRFADWYIQSAAQQAGFDACFIAPVEAALTNLGVAETPGSGSQRLNNWLSRKLYQLAWRYRHLVRPLLRPEWRHQVHVRLVERLAGQGSTPEALARGAKDLSLPRGINLFGYVKAESGIGQSARGNIGNIQAADIPLAVTNFQQGNVSRMNAQIEAGLLAEPRYNINLFHINADETVNAIEHLGQEVLKGRYNIGYWAWELQVFPDRWLAAIDLLDEIWVPSEFCRAAIAAKADIPVHCIPHSLTSPAINLHGDRSAFDLPQGPSLFLTMYDSLSLPERKNPQGAIAAFRQAQEQARGELNAHLVLKVSNLDKTPAHARELREIAAADPAITLIEGYLEGDDIFRLIDCCDVLLSLHRAEGFGLGLAEAMLLGKVVIATNWSGNLQFMTADNSLLIDYQLVEISEDYGPYEQGQLWAEPNLDSASAAIERVCREPELMQVLGEKAQQTIRDNFSTQHIGELIRLRLAEIDGALAETG